MKATGMSKEDIVGQVGYLITTLGEKGSMVSCKDGDTTIGVVPAKEVLDPHRGRRRFPRRAAQGAGHG